MEEPNAERGHKGGLGEERRLRREGAVPLRAEGGGGGGSLGKGAELLLRRLAKLIGRPDPERPHWGSRTPAAPSPRTPRTPHPSRAGRAEEGRGQGNGMGRGKEGKAETHTGGLGRLPVQEGVSKPLCAWHARF